MLANKNRFHGHGSLRYVYRNAKAARHPALTLKSVPNPRRKTPRVAVVVGKKIHKGAVGRNRIRRRLYEVIRNQLPLLTQSCDIVLIVTSAELMIIPHDELKDLVEQLFKKANLYKSTP